MKKKKKLFSKIKPVRKVAVIYIFATLQRLSGPALAFGYFNVPHYAASGKHERDRMGKADSTLLLSEKQF